MMTSEIYTLLWPEMFSEERGIKGERGKWSAYAFDVDHPLRKERGVRDSTMIIKTVKSNAQGLHCDGLILDDVVVPAFADTATGRSELSRSLGYFSSILNPGGWIKAVGTRYHPEDAYQSMIDARVPIWDDKKKEFTGEKAAWDVIERVAEDSPDRSGTGRFLWPRTEDPSSGKSYGFNVEELMKIRADYISHRGLVHFYSQYYNDPNDVGTQRINKDHFKYYDQRFLTARNDRIYFQQKRLNVYAAMDVAWSEGERADYTAIAVIGVDSDGFIYVLDLDRFRTSDFLTYYERIETLYRKWFFRELVVETNAAGSLVAQEVEAHVRRNGISLIVDRRAKNSRTGGKLENWAAVLEPRYHSKSVLHYKGGLIPTLEEELMSAKPRHDDLKDALCSAMSILRVPSEGRLDYKKINEEANVIVGRFGGRRRIGRVPSIT
jgi:phage terminase large subunit-like protein